VCKLIHILFYQVGKAQHTGCSLCAGELAPWAVKVCFFCSPDGIVNFGFSSYLNTCCYNGVIVRISDGEGLGGARVDVLNAMSVHNLGGSGGSGAASDVPRY